MDTQQELINAIKQTVGVDIKLLNPNALIPTQGSPHAAGWDIRTDKGGVLKPGERKLVSTGIAIAMHSDMECQVRPRSGLAVKYGITIVNTPGTIDPDYRGEIKVILLNTGNTAFIYERGDRIAQLVFSRFTRVNFNVVPDLEKSQRGSGGFGSTGIE